MSDLVITNNTSNKLLMPIATPADMMQARRAVEDIIKSGLKEGDYKDGDYGLIPGATKKVLFKSGAEKVSAAFGCFPKYEIIEKEVDHDRKNEFYYNGRRQESVGFYRYIVNCTLVSRSGEDLGCSIGSCSSMESKYISRPRNIENTVLKMAQKRAFVAATLNTFGLSSAFEQDQEDLRENDAITVDPIVEEPKTKDQMTDLFDINDSNARASLNQFMIKQGIPTDKLDDLAKSFHGQAKSEVLKKITEITKEHANDRS